MASVIVAGDSSGAITISAPSAAGSGVLTLPTGTDTLVGKATTDTLTNKTLVAPALGTPASGDISNCTSTNMVLVTPALGTPSALVGTNISGTSNAFNAGIGVNQTWQVVTGSRVSGTTYTNSTGKPIAAMIPNNASNPTLVVGGVTLTSGALVGSANTTFIVPPGLTYVWTGSFYSWAELR